MCVVGYGGLPCAATMGKSGRLGVGGEVRVAQRRRITVAATAGALLVIAAVVIAATLGNASAERSAAKSGIPAAKSAVAAESPIAALADPRSKNVSAVAFSPDGKLLATPDQNGSTYLWKVPTGKLSASLEPAGNIGGNGHPAFSPNGGFLAVANGDGDTYVWDVSTSKLLATFADPSTKGVNGTAFSPDGSFLATTDHNGSTYLWNMSWLGS